MLVQQHFLFPLYKLFFSLYQSIKKRMPFTALRFFSFWNWIILEKNAARATETIKLYWNENVCTLAIAPYCLDLTPSDWHLVCHPNTDLSSWRYAKMMWWIFSLEKTTFLPRAHPQNIKDSVDEYFNYISFIKSIR